MADSHAEQLSLATDWTGADSLPVLVANQLLTQLGVPSGVESRPEGAYLIFGHMSPPLIYGIDEIKQEQIEQLHGRAKVTPLVRLFVPATRLREFIDVLQECADKIDEAAAVAAPTGTVDA